MIRNFGFKVGIGWFFIVPALLIGATGFWIHAGYPGPLQNNLKGGFARFDSDSLVTENMDTLRPNGMDLLLGDSEAQSIQDLFAMRFGEDSVIRAKSGCSFIPKRAFREISHTIDCERFYHDSWNLVSKTSNSKIFIFNRYLPSSQQEILEFISFLRKISNNENSIILVGQPVEITKPYAAYSSLFFKRPLGSFNEMPKEDFDKSSIQRWAALKRELELFAPSVVRIVDSEKIICPNYPCEMFNDQGESKYTDSTHLSIYGAKSLIAVF